MDHKFAFLLLTTGCSFIVPQATDQPADLVDEVIPEVLDESSWCLVSAQFDDVARFYRVGMDSGRGSFVQAITLPDEADSWGPTPEIFAVDGDTALLAFSSSGRIELPLLEARLDDGQIEPLGAAMAHSSSPFTFADGQLVVAFDDTFEIYADAAAFVAGAVERVLPGGPAGDYLAYHDGLLYSMRYGSPRVTRHDEDGDVLDRWRLQRYDGDLRGFSVTRDFVHVLGRAGANGSETKQTLLYRFDGEGRPSVTILFDQQTHGTIRGLRCIQPQEDGRDG